MNKNLYEKNIANIVFIIIYIRIIEYNNTQYIQNYKIILYISYISINKYYMSKIIYQCQKIHLINVYKITVDVSDAVTAVVVVVVVVVVDSLVVAQPLPPLGTRLTAGSLLLCSLFKLGRLAGGRRAEGTFPRLCIPCLRGNVFFC